MISVTDYTTYNDIRAVLGLDDLELSDATLGLGTYSSALQRILRSTEDTIGKSLYAYYDELDAKPTLTEDEDTLFYLIKEFCTYTVAIACLPGLSLLVKKTESDGKATASRFSAESIFKDVATNVTQKWMSLKSEILTSIGGTTVYNSINPVTRVTPETDLVTNS